MLLALAGNAVTAAQAAPLVSNPRRDTPISLGLSILASPVCMSARLYRLIVELVPVAARTGAIVVRIYRLSAAAANVPADTLRLPYHCKCATVP
nr:hypothetical protein [uncultured Sphingomonas sp.]